MDKDFTVRSAKTGETLVITGSTLEKALRSEGLNPVVWLPFNPPPPEDAVASGQD